MPAVEDALGVRGTWLAQVANIAYVPDISNGRIEDVGDQDVFPVVLLRADETIVSDATRMMDVQKRCLDARLRAVWTQQHDMFDDADVALAVEQADTLPRELSLGMAGRYEIGRQDAAMLHRADSMNPNGTKVVSRGRPHILLRTQQNHDQMTDSLVHELSHTLDAVTEPMWCYDDAQELSRLALTTELAAYATEVAVAHVLDTRRA